MAGWNIAIEETVAKAKANRVSRSSMMIDWVSFQGVEIRFQQKSDKRRNCYHTRWQNRLLRYSGGWVDTFCLSGAASIVVAKELLNWGIAVSISSVEMAEEYSFEGSAWRRPFWLRIFFEVSSNALAF